jgi:hypothetical protein
MDVESLAKQLILKGMTDEQQTAVLQSIRATMAQSRELKKQKVGEQAQLVVQALKKIEADIRSRYDELGNKIEERVASIKDGKDGRDGANGRDGRAGRDGAKGPAGPRGADGVNGRDGRDGVDGVSVTDAKIDFDGSLIISLSSGREINVGEVVAPDLAEKIKVITNGGGTSQSVLDTLASLQTQINNLIPSQTGNAGKFLTTNGSVLSWATVSGSGLSYQGTWNAATNTPTLASGTGTSGYYYIVSTPGSTNLDGITDWKAGDWLLFNGTAWQKIDQSWATAGANDNITSMTGVTGGISSPDFIQFDTGATVTNAAGRMYWDATQQTMTVGLNANIAADIGQTLYAYVTNDESVTITKGQPVYMFAAAGDRVSVKLAYNTGDATSAKTLGICAEDIAAGQAGMVLCQGVQDGLNLAAYSPGDTLYLGATAGTLTATKPYAPNHLVYIGVVERANAGNGRLYVRVQNGYELDELHNVSAQSPSNGQTLIYNATTGLWTKGTLTAGTGISIANGAGSITVTNSGVTDFNTRTGSVTLGSSDVTTALGYTPVNKAGDTITGPTVVDVNSSSTALRLTQTGAGNALVVEDSTNPDATPTVVDASGRVIVGNTTSLTTFSVDAGVQNYSGSGYYTAGNFAADAFGSFFSFIKSRNATVGSHTIVQSGDGLGTVAFAGSDGTAYIRGAQIRVEVDGTPGTNDMPGRLLFSTTADGASSPTERFRISNFGGWGLAGANYGTANTQAIVSNGNAAAPTWQDVVTPTATQTLTNKTISADNNTISGIAASSFVLSNSSGNIDGAVAQKAIPTGVVVGTTDTQTLTNKTLTSPSMSDPTITGVATVAAGSATAPAITTTGDTNTGIYFPAADTVAFTEGGVESLRIDSSANLRFNSGYGSVATAYGCRAWVNFNGTGTISIRDDGNVTSLTDNGGTGDYTINFTNSMPDTNYAVVGSAQLDTSAADNNAPYVGVYRSSTALATGSVRVVCRLGNNTSTDATGVYVAIFR